MTDLMLSATSLWSGDLKHAKKINVYDDWRRRPTGLSKHEAVLQIASKYGISGETVRRYIKEIETNGYRPSIKNTQGRRIYAWSPEALSYLKSFYLCAMRDVGACTYRNAYNKTVSKAEKEGWQYGSEQSAYIHLRDINAALPMYAHGGRRALDNMFWIARDLESLDPFEVIVGDQHRFDFWCVDEDKTVFRPECYLWLDMRTRLVYGLAFDRHYNTGTVLNALKTGLSIFGKFGSTYNDNGSAEKSARADLVIENLQTYGMRWSDTAELYKDKDGRFVITDEQDNVVQVCETRTEWYKRNRRIFARVKNAKTKPIERFFSTLEQILLDDCLPGYIKEMGMSAPEEEEAKRRLDWQRAHNYVLTYQDFINAVAQAVDKYNNRIHATLKCSPLQALKSAVDAGFCQTYIDPSDIAYLFFDRKYCVVHGDRIRLDNEWYIGPDATTELILQNRGTLVGLSRKKIEVRYDPENPAAGVYAIDPRDNRPIVLRKVEAIEMFDDKAASDSFEWKRGQIKSVVDAFGRMVAPQQLLKDGSSVREYLEAKKAVASNAPVSPVSVPSIEQSSVQSLSDEQFRATVAEKICAEVEIKPKHQKVFRTERDRYQWCLDEDIAGRRLTSRDQEFKQKFEQKMTDQDLNYFTLYAAANGN